MKYAILFLLCLQLALFSSEVPNFNDLGQTKNAVIFLTTPRSGSNLISGCLSAITRKPISWLYWKYDVFNPNSGYRRNTSYNRLELPMVSDLPLLYRTHYEYGMLAQIPSSLNKLIFVTRNPKELLFRKFYQTAKRGEIPHQIFIETFLDGYLHAFNVYENWYPDNRFLVFYEDYLQHDDAILLDLLQFMNEDPLYLDDFLTHKQEYMAHLLNSYTQQHRGNSGGASSKNGPQQLYYSKDVDPAVLIQVDDYLKKAAPTIWTNYLQRFETP